MPLIRPLLGAIACLLAVTPARAADAGRVLDLGQGVKLELVRVPKGKFRQGSPAGEKGRADDETAREVTLSEDFYLGKYPVTRGQFARFVQAAGYRTEAERGPSGGFGLEEGKLVQRRQFTWRNPGFAQTDEHPVVLVTYEDAQAFLAWLAKTTGQRCELPTEAQWEYACRAGSATAFNSGGAEADLAAAGWHKANARDGTRRCGGKKANAFGLFDMHGNVRNWCRDWYGPYEAGVVVDPEEKRADRTKPARRVLRGGSFLTEARHCRAAARGRNTPGSRNGDNGFRVLVGIGPGASGAVPATWPSGFLLADASRAWELFVGLGCVALVAAVIFVIACMIYVRSRQSPGRSQRPGVGVRTGTDGFWLDVGRLPVGSVVRYRYLAGGTGRTGSTTTTASGREAFIYTGDTPTDVDVLEVVTPTGTTWQDDHYDNTTTSSGGADLPLTALSGGSSSAPEAAPPAAGYPSAY